MQDSLGGNAKTLMFVNISPADYNQDETVTALTYATRVKLITNTAEKQQVGWGSGQHPLESNLFTSRRMGVGSILMRSM